jgi:hypothetical protein
VTLLALLPIGLVACGGATKEPDPWMPDTAAFDSAEPDEPVDEHTAPDEEEPLPGPGECDGVAEAIVIERELNQDTQLCAEDSYSLLGSVLVKEGTTLYIEPGTTLNMGDNASFEHGELVIGRGARIEAIGTVEAPIIMTGPGSEDYPGLWGGLVLHGLGPSSQDTAGDPEDSSGTLQYLKLHNAGADSSTAEGAALRLISQGSGTTIDHIEIKSSASSAISVQGGTVDLSYLMIRNTGRRALTWRGGYTGTVQYAIIDSLRQKSGLSGQQWGDDAEESEINETPEIRSHPKLYNLTIINSAGHAVRLRLGTGAELANSVIISSTKCAIYVDEHSAAAGEVDIHHLVIAWPRARAICLGQNEGGADGTPFVSALMEMDAMLDGYIPRPDSPTLERDNVDQDISAFMGAIESTESDWTVGWTD